MSTDVILILGSRDNTNIPKLVNSIIDNSNIIPSQTLVVTDRKEEWSNLFNVKSGTEDDEMYTFLMTQAKENHACVIIDKYIPKLYTSEYKNLVFNSRKHNTTLVIIVDKPFRFIPLFLRAYAQKVIMFKDPRITCKTQLAGVYNQYFGRITGEFHLSWDGLFELYDGLSEDTYILVSNSYPRFFTVEQVVTKKVIENTLYKKMLKLVGFSGT